MAKKGDLIQFFRFALVGVVATLINLVFLYFFTEFFNIYYMISAIFAFFIADISKYVLNKTWTFYERLRDGFFRTYCKFLLVSLIALGINLFFLYIFTDIVGIYYLYSQVLAIAISLWINFLGSKFWTFKNKI